MQLPQRFLTIEHRLERRHRRAHEGLVVNDIGQAVAYHMVVQVELGIIFECRVREVERYESQLLPIAMQQMHPMRHMFDQLIVSDGPVEDLERADVQRPRVRFTIKERSILTAHAMG